tara:strand:- start:1058 stop:1414 length:357 start_codon:yes stop_codon:yes gene_type:complete
MLNLDDTLSKNRIDQLYKNGEKLFTKSLIIIYKTEIYENNFYKPIISISKKKIKKAVNRNYLRRIIKELYFSSKKTYFDSKKYSLNMMIVYNSSCLIDFKKLKEELLPIFIILKDKVR